MKNVSPKCLLISHFCSFLLDFATLMRSLVNTTWTWSYSVAFGNPLPQITWTLDSLPLNEAWHVRVGDFVTDVYTVNSYVNISSAKVEDGGLYSCQARNSAGFINKSARVNVLGPPVIRSMANVTALSGQSLYLLCPYAGHPIQGIHWIKGITCSLFSLVVWIFRLLSQIDSEEESQPDCNFMPCSHRSSFTLCYFLFHVRSFLMSSCPCSDVSCVLLSLLLHILPWRWWWRWGHRWSSTPSKSPAEGLQ